MTERFDLFPPRNARIAEHARAQLRVCAGLLASAATATDASRGCMLERAVARRNAAAASLTRLDPRDAAFDELTARLREADLRLVALACAEDGRAREGTSRARTTLAARHAPDAPRATDQPPTRAEVIPLDRVQRTAVARRAGLEAPRRATLIALPRPSGERRSERPVVSIDVGEESHDA